MKTRLVTLVTIVLSLAFVEAGQAAVIYSNNAGTPLVQSFDTTTGAQIFSFTGSGSNGRGVVTVGDVIYTTDASSGFVGAFDRTTGAPIPGKSFTIAGAGGISTISFDGDNFWTSDYTGTNKAFYVSPTGVVLKTITLSESQGFYDGLEFFNDKLIANNFDGGFRGANQYSIYDTDGNLLVKDFINTGGSGPNGHGNGTGIAFDGTNFYISDIFNGRITIWDGVNGGFIGALTLLGNIPNLIEDLSFDFEGRPDTCRVDCNSVPEPGSLALLGIALAGLGFAARRRTK